MPNKSSTKDTITNFLNDHGVPVQSEWRKDRLLRELDGFVASSGGKEALTVRAVEEIARAAGIQILRLPPYHCQLNPIEHTWAYIKGKLCDFSNPKSTKLETLCKKAEEIAYGMSQEMKLKFYNNAIHVEDDFITKEGLSRIITMDIEPMVIELDEGEEDPEDFFDTSQFMDTDQNLEEEYEEESEERMAERELEEARESAIISQISRSSDFHPINLSKMK